MYKHVVLPNRSEFWSISADVDTGLRSGGEGRRGGHNSGQKRRKNRWKVEFSPLDATVPVGLHARAHARTLQEKFVLAPQEAEAEGTATPSGRFRELLLDYIGKTGLKGKIT